MADEITSIDDFLLAYDHAYWLEDRLGCERWTSGLGEGSTDESVWFCCHCGTRVDDPHEGCEECENE